jgi:hypothetical protein
MKEEVIVVHFVVVDNYLVTYVNNVDDNFHMFDHHNIVLMLVMLLNYKLDLLKRNWFFFSIKYFGFFLFKF